VTRNAEALGGAVWLAVGLFLVWAGRDLGIGSVREPGSGFVVFWGGILVVLFAGPITLGALRHGGASLGSLWEDTRWGRVIAVVLALILYGLLLGRLGFLLATVPLMLALLRLVDPVRWSLAIPVAFGATFGVWWVLERLLSIRLPQGVLDWS
jgi:putative tricarboxylic transport membrane protein